MSGSRRLLRLPSSLVLTDGPAAWWGGLRALVGGREALLPHSGETLKGVLACPWDGRDGQRGEKYEFSAGVDAHADWQDLFFSALKQTPE